MVRKGAWRRINASNNQFKLHLTMVLMCGIHKSQDWIMTRQLRLIRKREKPHFPRVLLQFLVGVQYGNFQKYATIISNPFPKVCQDRLEANTTFECFICQPFRCCTVIQCRKEIIGFITQMYYGKIVLHHHKWAQLHKLHSGLQNDVKSCFNSL